MQRRRDAQMAKIFLIEDNHQLRENTRRSLELAGHDAEAFAEGSAALERCGESWPDVILCDVMMPGMDGHEVLRRVRMMPGGARVPFVFLTALAERGDVRRGMDTGADDYLTKPFSMAELFSAVESRLRAREHAREEVEERLRAVDLQKLRVLPHEFRTPLNGILGGISLMKDEFAHLGDSFAETAGMIEQSAMRMERTLLNYVLYAELTSGRFRMPDAEHVEVGAIVAAASSAEAAAWERAGDLQLSQISARWRVSREVLDVMLREIVSNAFKFSQPGTPVRIAMDTEGRVIVEDSGSGMNPDEIARVRAFQQFGRETREQQGLGLGLAICHELERLGGPKLKLASRSDGGLLAQLSPPEDLE